ncbi:uncharacterized protein LOC123448426 isoform X2 [Hordeum vulgare subsp. vulgare]|uniref:uncharacterized protein LOC123448426 isoform X2 n=1 Tax=Hordeum vulgare subsp. vulgare TaxID=112509 RepID=UPI001D1A3624|nr:uncharacterized protein LOC123448426 isoform X2 [Hordeum vulgare subsp. vulgare]
MGSDGRVLLWPRRRRSQANQLEEEKLAVQQQETDNFVYPNQDRAGDRRGRLHRQPRRAATARRGLPRRCRRQPRELLRARRSPGNTRGTSPSTRTWMIAGLSLYGCEVLVEMLAFILQNLGVQKL